MIAGIEHSRHRSLHGVMLNLLGSLITYCLKPEKPSLNITNTEKSGLMAMAQTDLRLHPLLTQLSYAETLDQIEALLPWNLAKD